MSVFSWHAGCVVPGITNTAGRILAGFLADLKCVNGLLLHNMALVCAGLLCFADMFCREIVSMCFFSALFGLCIGLFCHQSLLSRLVWLLQIQHYHSRGLLLGDIILSSTNSISTNNKGQSNLVIGSIAANWGFQPGNLPTWDQDPV